MERHQTVSLGCGTLILIALIVIFFGRGPSEELQRKVDKIQNDVVTTRSEIQQLRGEVSLLKLEVDKQTRLLRDISDKLDKNQLRPEAQ